MRKRLTGISFAILLYCSSFGQDDQSKSKRPEDLIRRYWFVLLTKGEHRSQDSATAARIQAGHLANIQKLYLEGKIKVAGPFGEEGDPRGADWQGLFIFDCETKEEVEKLLQTDPAIAAGRMVFQVKPWYTVPTVSFVPGKPKEKLF
jgi:uncharacterized protein YciI